MQHLSGHPNIVELIATYEDKKYIHLVMEYCGGGELSSCIRGQPGTHSENHAAEVIRTIAKVVHHCHTMNVVHRDLKPENFLFSSSGKDAVLKATDFGLSRFFKEEQVFEVRRGNALDLGGYFHDGIGHLGMSTVS